MAHSRFVNAFSRISKNYVFRFKIFCHIDLVLPYFCFRCGGGGGAGWGGGEDLVLYTITMYSFKCEIQTQPTMLERWKVLCL